MQILITSLIEARTNFATISERFREVILASDGTVASSEESIGVTIAAMNQFFDIVEGVESKRADFVVNDITDIGEHGLSLLEKLMQKADSLQLINEKMSLGQITLVIADWVIQQDGTLNYLEPIVDALAQVANATSDTEQLVALAAFMGEIADACSDSIKQDIEVNNMHRPWRILHINRGIVAIRTNNIATIHSVFASLIAALPLDAANFFKEGMSEMVRLNYPDAVREVMQEYFEQTDSPKIH